jgi:hypothetical protein
MQSCPAQHAGVFGACHVLFSRHAQPTYSSLTRRILKTVSLGAIWLHVIFFQQSTQQCFTGPLQIETPTLLQVTVPTAASDRLHREPSRTSCKQSSGSHPNITGRSQHHVDWRQSRLRSRPPDIAGSSQAVAAIDTCWDTQTQREQAHDMCLGLVHKSASLHSMYATLEVPMAHLSLADGKTTQERKQCCFPQQGDNQRHATCSTGKLYSCIQMPHVTYVAALQRITHCLHNCG